MPAGRSPRVSELPAGGRFRGVPVGLRLFFRSPEVLGFDGGVERGGLQGRVGVIDIDLDQPLPRAGDESHMQGTGGAASDDAGPRCSNDITLFVDQYFEYGHFRCSSESATPPLKSDRCRSVVLNGGEVRQVSVRIEAFGNLRGGQFRPRAEGFGLNELRPHISVASPTEPPFLALARADRARTGCPRHAWPA